MGLLPPHDRGTGHPLETPRAARPAARRDGEGTENVGTAASGGTRDGHRPDARTGENHTRGREGHPRRRPTEGHPAVARAERQREERADGGPRERKRWPPEPQRRARPPSAGEPRDRDAGSSPVDRREVEERKRPPREGGPARGKGTPATSDRHAGRDRRRGGGTKKGGSAGRGASRGCPREGEPSAGRDAPKAGPRHPATATAAAAAAAANGPPRESHHPRPPSTRAVPRQPRTDDDDDDDGHPATGRARLALHPGHDHRQRGQPQREAGKADGAQSLHKPLFLFPLPIRVLPEGPGNTASLKSLQFQAPPPVLAGWRLDSGTNVDSDADILERRLGQ
ncbi:5E5 antigen-like [Sorex fumeus]|uniref:5E5 antigen-like n=1 Tax=Sorex fumeus TaxID=62283 RepID=UPI0024AC9195|nr:5E5 antigen-like [Sorex fumeus]XP_055965005.1 5E5 antigen-like [Sorex fumeus]XP_055965007.1 5E5 antigen-like [Sorex fumeus]